MCFVTRTPLTLLAPAYLSLSKDRGAYLLPYEFRVWFGQSGRKSVSVVAALRAEQGP